MILHRFLNKKQLRSQFILIASLLVFPLSLVTAQNFVELGRSTGHDGPFQNPQAVTVSVDGTIYVVDSGNNRIQLFNHRGAYLRTIGGFGFAADQFDRPLDIWAGSLINIYVADFNNRRVQRYDRDLNYISSLENNEALDRDFQFEEVKSCAVNSNNDLFVLENSENKIIKFNRHGQAERSFGSYESGPGELEDPQQIEISQNKFIIVSDARARAILIFDFFGTYIKSVQYKDFLHPSGMCVLPDQTILLADPSANSVFSITPNFQQVNTIHFQTRKPVSRLTDVAFWKKEKQILLYLLDGNELVFGIYK